MRDPERLDKYYDEIKRLHKTYCPDWRIGQLFVNFSEWLQFALQRDPFYINEQGFLALIHEYFADTFKDYDE